jgi:hypothetical protein
MLTCDPADHAGFAVRLEELAGGSDRETAITACFWLSNVRENSGDIPGALAAAERALRLASEEDGPWSAAMPRAMLAQLALHTGDRTAAAAYASAALPVMQRLGAADDEVQLRSLLAFCAIADGRLGEAEDQIAAMDDVAETWSGFGGRIFRHVCHAELLLARGEREAGLAAHRDCVVRMRALEFPGMPRTGLEPWTLFGISMALAAHALYADGAAEVQDGQALLRECRSAALAVLRADDADRDYPVAGMLLFALGSWSLRHAAAPEQQAIALLVLAERFAYNSAAPSLLWERIEPAAEQAAPGLIAELRGQYAAHRPAGLLTQACRAVQQIPA